MKTELIVGAVVALIFAFVSIKVIMDWLKSRPKFEAFLLAIEEPGESEEIIIKNISNKTTIVHAYQSYIISLNRAQDIRDVDLGQYRNLKYEKLAPKESLNILISDNYRINLKRNEKLYIEIFIDSRSSPITKEVKCIKRSNLPC